ncbi:MAG TPA: CAP domain-containing protein [Rhizomicrobium sp.]|nr:CAP domain-containing protein [Rhizomicrobium sp.]
MGWKIPVFVALWALPTVAQAQFLPRPPALLAPLPVPGAGPCQGADQAFAREAEALIAQAIDAERAKYAPAAPPLAPDPDIARIAQTRSCDMAHGADFSHRDAAGRFIAGDMVRARFGPYGTIGENIMEMGGDTMEMVGRRPFGPEEFARVAVQGWMESPGHRANILNPRYDSSGIGVAMVGDQAFATQVFRGPAATGRASKEPERDE